MIRLTVLYNLPEDEDEEAFLAWRLSEHQEANASIPGVMRTDFGRVTECWPADSMPGFQFQTTVDWPDRQTFEKAFYDESVQANLKQNLERLGDYSFMISEILTESTSTETEV